MTLFDRLNNIRTGIIAALEKYSTSQEIPNFMFETPMILFFPTESFNDEHHLAYLNFFIYLTDYFNELFKEDLKSNFTLDFLPEDVFHIFPTIEYVYGYFIIQYNNNKK